MYSSALPLISCIMPTANRRRFVPQAIRYFQAQDYPNRELVILDDGADSIADLIPDDPCIRYIRQTGKRTLGRKRNEAVEACQGDLIMHWDDDDWHAPHRIRYQVEALLAAQVDVCGINTLLFYEPRTQRAFRYIYPPQGQLWLSGSTLCYTRRYWQAHPFPEVNVGEDARFIWQGNPARMLVLPEYTFHVGIIHEHNTSPKTTNGTPWSSYSVEVICELMGSAWKDYHTPTRESVGIITPVRNVFACLVHENTGCIIDLVRNLRHLDPLSEIILYNGSANPDLLSEYPYQHDNAIVHPTPTAQKWGALHTFALDCMAFALEAFPFDTLTIVDSDQLAIRSGYCDFLGRSLPHQTKFGLLGCAPYRQTASTTVRPAMTALSEFALWQPFLKKFPQGETHWVYWTFWPSTVFSSDAARDLVQLFASDTQLTDIMRKSRLWATEEILFPTLIKLLGYEYLENPCSYSYVQYRHAYSTAQLNAAFGQSNAYWMHPVERRYGNPLRHTIRQRFNYYPKAAHQKEDTMNGHAELLLTLPILSQMKTVEGWLEDDEADLLMAACATALKHQEPPCHVVEIGSYCGRSTIVLASVIKALSPASRVYAIDPHDGKIGAADQGVMTHSPTLEKFKYNVARAGVTDVVEVIKQHSYEVDWQRPIHFLLVDGLHDYGNVSRDFKHFEPQLAPRALIAFHDYADYYPGVQAFVDELLASGRYKQVRLVRSMMVIQVG